MSERDYADFKSDTLLTLCKKQRDLLEEYELALRTISYLAHNGSQDRPLWKRLSMIAEYADKAMNKAAQEKADE